MITRSTKIFLELLATLLVLVAIAVAVAAWRLSTGPISLGFLTPLIEDAINSSTEAATIKLDDTVLAWSEAHRTLDIRAVGVRVLGPDGMQMAELPEVAISLSGRALLRGTIAPTRFDVLGAQIALTRLPDGSFDVPSAGDSGGQSSSWLPILLHEFVSPPNRERAMGALSEVRISDASVTITDLGTNRIWRAPSANIQMIRDAAGLRAQARLVVEFGGMPTQLTATALYDAGANQIDITARTTSIQFDALAELDPRLAQLAALKMPVSGSTQMRLDSAGRLLGLGFNLNGADGVFSDPKWYPEPLRIRQLRIRGTASAKLERIDVAEAVIDLNGPSVALVSAITGLDTRPQITIDGTVRAVPVNDLRVLWPQGVGQNARRWITTNLSGGTIEETKFSVALAAADPSFAGFGAERVSGNLRVVGVDVNYLSPMPRVRNVSGTVTLGLKRIDIAVTSGGIDNLRVTEGKIAFTQLDTNDEQADINVAITGPLREALRLVDGPPLGFVKKINRTPDEFAGDAAIRLGLRFPLINSLKIEQLDIAATADVTNFTQQKAALGQDITDGKLALKVDQRGAELNGTVTLAGAAAVVRVTRNFLANAATLGQVKAKTTLDANARRALGFDFAPYLDGRLPVDLTLTDQRGGRSDLLLDLVLSDAALSIPEIEWSKATGVPGTAQIRLALVDDRPTAITQFRASAADLDVQGSATFAGDGRTIRRVQLDRAKAGLNDVRGSYERGDGSIAIDLTGDSINVGPLLRDKSPPQATRPRLQIKADLARVYLGPERTMDRVLVEGVRGVDRWEALSLQALVGNADARNVGISLREENGRQRLDASAADGGALLKVLDVTPNVVGGKIEVNGNSDPSQPENPIIGSVHMTEFRVVNAPILAKVLSVALLTGIGDALRGEGITFERLDANYVFRDPVLEIKDAQSSGPAIGITAKGNIDIGAETIDLEGTLVPAYAINSLVGQIPLIGDILVGGKGSGLFAANYRVSGTTADPKVSINPLSTIAPGFLRKLFNIFDGGTSPTGNEPRPDLGTPSGAPGTLR